MWYGKYEFFDMYFGLDNASKSVIDLIKIVLALPLFLYDCVQPSYLCLFLKRGTTGETLSYVKD